jgi:hypothetical protein
MKKKTNKSPLSAGTDNGQKRLKKTTNPHQYTPSSGDVSREDIENYPAVRYLKTFARAVQSKTTGNRECSILCSDCPFGSNNNGLNLHCAQFEMQHPEQAVAIAIKWEREHGQQAHTHTYLDELFARFPNAIQSLLEDQAREEEIYRCNFFGGECSVTLGQKMPCSECWNQPYKESEESEK